jgi:site-specific recombinase XerD
MSIKKSGRLSTQRLKQAKKVAGRSAAYLRDIAYRLGGVAKAFNVEVRQLSPQDVADYLGKLKLQPRGFNNHGLMLRTFFGFCQARGWLSKDVDLLSRVEKRSGTQAEIEIFTHEELRKVLRAASPRVAACIAIKPLLAFARRNSSG